MVRRTRTFIQENYAETDPQNGRRYLTFADGTRSYFPLRVPKTLKFKIDSANVADQYAQLFSAPVVDTINGLTLPRYGLGNYVLERPHDPPTAAEAKVIADLSRAGKRLMGFCRTNLFKRLESSGFAFVQSIERHILRNFVYLHAIENGLSLPIGTQDAALLDARFTDADSALFSDEDNDDDDAPDEPDEQLNSEQQFRQRAAEIYEQYAGPLKRKFRWLSCERFVPALAADLLEDIQALLGILKNCGDWNAANDAKLSRLASSRSFGCVRACGNDCTRTPKSSARMRRSSRTTATTTPFATSSRRRPASLMARPRPKSISVRMPIKSGRTPSTGSRNCSGSFPTCQTSSFQRSRMSRVRSSRKEYWPSCEPLKATTPSLGWIGTASR